MTRSTVVEWQSTDQRRAEVSAAVARMVRSGDELIVSSGPELVLQACLEASNLPIVMIAINYDPISRGYIQSLANPGGRVTGVMLRQPELAAKQVELLAESFPERKSLAIVWDSISADQFALPQIGSLPRRKPAL